MLDSNEYIFGLSGTKASCVQLIDQLDTLRVFVPLMVVREVERNLDLMYSLSSVFFKLIVNQENIIIVWSPPPETLVLAYIERRFSKEDATIAAAAEQVQSATFSRTPLSSHKRRNDFGDTTNLASSLT
jgi:hypothetical protein